MRDIALSAIVVALLLVALRYPVVGAYLWAWLSLMNPHKLTYGFASTMPFAQAAAAVTLLGLMFTRRKAAVPMNAIVVTLLAMLLWMSVTSVFAIAGFDTVLERWIFVMKIQLMLLVTWMLVIDPRQLRSLVWVVTLSVGYFGIKGGVFTVMTGGSGRVWGPPGGMLEENNALAVALVMLMPMFQFLRETEPRRWLRLALLASMGVCFFSILGSQSRGALLALLAMALFLGLKGKYPVRTSLVLAVLVVLVIAFMPDSWTNRMNTMRTFEEDTSAMSRIWTWQTLWNVALDRPLIGAGFRADSLAVFSMYAPRGPEWQVFVGSVFVAHSIYFQMLGEHGFVGLLLFITLGLATWRTASRLAASTSNDADFKAWMPTLMRMCQVSLIGFAVGGAFLSLAYLDVPYYIMGFVVITDGIVRRSRSARTATTPVASLQGQPPLHRPTGP